MAKNTRSSKGGMELAEELQREMTAFDPIKRQLKINQFKWTDRQKEFLELD